MSNYMEDSMTNAERLANRLKAERNEQDTYIASLKHRWHVGFPPPQRTLRYFGKRRCPLCNSVLKDSGTSWALFSYHWWECLTENCGYVWRFDDQRIN